MIIKMWGHISWLRQFLFMIGCCSSLQLRASKVPPLTQQNFSLSLLNQCQFSIIFWANQIVDLSQRGKIRRSIWTRQTNGISLVFLRQTDSWEKFFLPFCIAVLCVLLCDPGPLGWGHDACSHGEWAVGVLPELPPGAQLDAFPGAAHREHWANEGQDTSLWSRANGTLRRRSLTAACYANRLTGAQGLPLVAHESSQ